MADISPPKAPQGGPRGAIHTPREQQPTVVLEAGGHLAACGAIGTYERQDDTRRFCLFLFFAVPGPGLLSYPHARQRHSLETAAALVMTVKGLRKLRAWGSRFGSPITRSCGVGAGTAEHSAGARGELGLPG